MQTPAGKGRIGVACAQAGVSRAGFYRHAQAREPRATAMELRDAIQRIAVENRCYGYRRIGQELRRQGWVVNHKRLRQILREDNLLSLRKRHYVLTTQSRHPYYVYPNEAARLQLDGCNQLWVADITYIRLQEEFLYLAVVLDAYSRRVVGWELDDTLEARLALRALERALADRPVPAGIVHHSDRGVQYCCRDYIARLEQHGFRISMSRCGNPYDNARAESFMKTLKCEEVYLENYRDRAHVLDSLTHFIEQVYNRRRLHSSLGYQSPVGFELALAATSAGGLA